MDQYPYREDAVGAIGERILMATAVRPGDAKAPPGD
jgi:hypothetical protein